MSGALPNTLVVRYWRGETLKTAAKKFTSGAGTSGERRNPSKVSQIFTADCSFN